MFCLNETCERIQGTRVTSASLGLQPENGDSFSLDAQWALMSLSERMEIALSKDIPTDARVAFYRAYAYLPLGKDYIGVITLISCSLCVVGWEY